MLLTAPPVPAEELPRQGAHSGSNSKQEWQTQRSHRPPVLSSPASALEVIAGTLSLVSRRLTRDKAPAMTSKGDVKTALAAQVLGAETTVFAVLCTLTPLPRRVQLVELPWPDLLGSWPWWRGCAPEEGAREADGSRQRRQQ